MLRFKRWLTSTGVVLMLIGSLSFASSPLRSASPGRLSLQLSKEPKLGETVQLTATFTANKDISLLKIEFLPTIGTKIESGDSDITTTIKKGETKTFSVQVQFTATPADISCRVGNCILAKNKAGVETLYWYEQIGSGVRRVVIDERTQQMGTDEERNRRFATESPEKTDYPLGIQYGRSPQNRNLMQLFLRDEPQLDKSEALWLVDKAEQDYAKDPWAHETAQSAKERDPDGTPSVFRRAVERVINEAKLKTKQTGKTKIIVYREMIEEWKKARKHDQPTDEGFLQMSPGKKDSPPRVKGNWPLAVTGRFYYKKHIFDRTGLKGTVTLEPLRKALVRIYDNATGSPTFLGQTFTNSNGNYSLTVQLDDYWDWHPVWPVVCATGPTSSGQDAYRVFVVSDTVTQYPPMTGSIQKVWRYNLMTQWLPYWQGSWDFGDSCFAEHALYPTSPQPKSGSVNIYDALLKVYEFMTGYNYTNGSVLTSVRAVWEPGYQGNMTSYSRDTIWVQGDTLFANGSDEWDDHSLCHEYGHHIMSKCAVLPPNIGYPHQWHLSYPNYPNLAYPEGWATYYHHNNNLTVTDDDINTIAAIGRPGAIWTNVEDPWQMSWAPPDSMRSGPWCEAGVCGVLHDIYDATVSSECPYPSYPYPSWPDTGLADSIAQGFSPSWDITDNYQINNHFTYTIYEFLSGWMHPPAHPDYSYGDIGWLNKVLKHHRIPWNRPDAPTGLTAVGKCPEVYMLLNWNAVSGVMGYNIYRSVDDLPYSYTRRNIELITGTEFCDYESQYTLWRYAVTSVDSQGNESDFSQTVSQSYACTNPDRPGSQSGGALSLIPTEFGLSQNVPNPFIRGTAIRYALPRDVHAALRVYDIQGRLIRTLVDEDQRAAYHQVNWDLKSDAGVELPAGVYFIRMEAGDFRKTRKLVVVR